MFEQLQDVKRGKGKIPAALLAASIEGGWKWIQNGFKKHPGDHPIKNMGGVWKAMDSSKQMQYRPVTNSYINGVDNASKSVIVSTSSQAKFDKKVSTPPTATCVDVPPC